MTLRQYIESLEAVAKQHGDQIRVVSWSDAENQINDVSEPSLHSTVKGSSEQLAGPMTHKSWLGEKVVVVS